ncbi:hypothetical protein HNR37_000649 [Desulfurispira natronophila]|uniref:Uncharacterized protein n=1 Tax=Desulfurispira natronophila TaxID=682562 RepID=A0A7W7Y3C0_9BACT|nr:hypothetical protein [Desulfurispira natronophila]
MQLPVHQEINITDVCRKRVAFCLFLLRFRIFCKHFATIDNTEMH